MAEQRQPVVLTARKGEAERAHAIALDLRRRLGDRDVTVEQIEEPGYEDRRVLVALDMRRPDAEQLVRETLDAIDPQWNEALLLD